MTPQTRLLRAHYARLLRRGAVWLEVGIMALGSMMATGGAQAAQLTTRSTTLGSSAVSASTTYDFQFKPGVTATIKSIRFEVCTSPLEQTTCTTPSGASMSSGVFSTSSPTTAPFTSNWATGTGGQAPSANAFWIVYSTGDSLSNSSTYTVRLTTITNPSTVNQSFYTRITTFTDAGGTAEQDFGAMAVSTARQITASANVQESLTFCVGTSGTGCSGGGLTGTTVNLGTGTDNVLSTSTPSGGTSLMAIDTNATSGYVITYVTSSPGGTGGTTCAGSLSSSNDCISDFGGTAGTFSAGTAKFGINLKNNATPDIGAEVSGSGSGTASAPYATVDNFAFQGGTTPRTVASATGPTLSNLYTVAYAAQAGNTTKPGAYSVTFTWVATGTF